jgi:hypothetical protein
MQSRGIYLYIHVNELAKNKETYPADCFASIYSLYILFLREYESSRYASQLIHTEVNRNIFLFTTGFRAFAKSRHPLGEALFHRSKSEHIFIHYRIPSLRRESASSRRRALV